MPRRLRPRHDATDESWWEEAVSVPLESDASFELQLAGAESLTRTVFVRVKSAANDAKQHLSASLSMENIVDLAMKEMIAASGLLLPLSARGLLSLGSVWVLDPSTVDRPQNRPIWQRLIWTERAHGNGTLPQENTTLEEIYNVNHQNNKPPYFYYKMGSVVRVHANPSRFPVSVDYRKDQISDLIISEEDDVGFFVVNKPGGLPSHATVDNGVENLLYQFQEFRSSPARSSEDSSPPYCSLPQRLDTETSGLILVATKKSFASYISKALQAKSLNQRDVSLNESLSAEQKDTIEKQYKCLVYFSSNRQEATRTWDDLRRYMKEGTMVQHFLDSKSPAPKRFVSPSTLLELKKESTTTPGGTTTKWLECRLRIIGVSEMGLVTTKARPSCPAFSYNVAEVNIELLTGRTHQIRGQMAALGCPIVGDPLYKLTDRSHSPRIIVPGESEIVPQRNRGGPLSPAGESNDASPMALQCSHLAFTLAPDALGAEPPSASDEVATIREQFFSFLLEKPWWEDRIAWSDVEE